MNKMHLRHYIHGMTGTPEHRIWVAMKQRCKRSGTYTHKKGIKVCDRWTDDFRNFYEDMGPIPDDGQRWTIDRIDNNGDYEPGNCRWATYKQQAQNMKRHTTHSEERKRKISTGLKKAYAEGRR